MERHRRVVACHTINNLIITASSPKVISPYFSSMYAGDDDDDDDDNDNENGGPPSHKANERTNKRIGMQPMNSFRLHRKWFAFNKIEWSGADVNFTEKEKERINGKLNNGVCVCVATRCLTPYTIHIQIRHTSFEILFYRNQDACASADAHPCT